MTPIFVVEVDKEWRMEVYQEFTLSVDYYAEFSELVFL
jgi:hypothetical protein